MTEVRIFESKKTLEVTKTFAKAASRYGSEAYMKLRSARNDYPDFKVVIRSTTAKKQTCFKGLTYAYMEKYIEAHDDENKTTMKKLRTGSSPSMRKSISFTTTAPRFWTAR